MPRSYGTSSAAVDQTEATETAGAWKIAESSTVLEYYKAFPILSGINDNHTLFYDLGI